MPKLTTDQKAHVDKWLDILENGEYKQGNNKLKIIDEETGVPKYCCLGVAAEAVLDKQFVPASDSPSLCYKIIDPWGDIESTIALAKPDNEKLGLDVGISRDESDRFRILTGAYLSSNSDRAYACILMNDTLNFTFKEIANVFRKMGWDE